MLESDKEALERGREMLSNAPGCICGHLYNLHRQGTGCAVCSCAEYRSIQAQELEERSVGMNAKP